ncbi:MAG: tRNA adenosine(34) deaminase TadA [Candidatus Aquicultorales bacterium]
MSDEKYMRLALEEAVGAGEAGDVPVGAVLVCGDKVLVKARNEREARHDPTGHAEIIAIREASRKLGRWRLTDCTLYVTKEPCPMCAGAIFQARLGRLVFGPYDPKGGAAGSLFNIVDDDRLNHQVEIRSGVLEEEASDLLRAFFQERRKSSG